MALTTAPLLMADSIGKSYAGRRVLTSAYVHAVPGQISALLGRNGSGKTTLLEIAVGLVRADHGTLHFDGAHLPRPRLHEMAARGLFYWSPDRPLLSPGATVDAHLRGTAEQVGGRDADHVIEELRLGTILGKRAGSLSGGEQQRCHLALAMLTRPRCFIADEPFRGLAPLDAEATMACFRRAAAAGAAVLITGHECTFVFDVASEVLWLAAGTTRFLGPPADATDDERFRREFLGSWRPA